MEKEQAVVDEDQTIATTSVLVTFRDVLVHTRIQGIPVAMAPLPTKDEMLSWQIGTHRGPRGSGPPTQLMPWSLVKYQAGVLPPPMHMWWRGATALALGIDGCKIAKIPPFKLCRRYKPQGTPSKVKGAGRVISQVQNLFTKSITY